MKEFEKMEALDPEKVSGGYVDFEGEDFYVIRNFNKMRPFFMTILSATDHWLFISSNGALSAGRRNPESALFPYYTDDKITDSAGVTGSRTIIRVNKNSAAKTWEPFNEDLEGIYNSSFNLYKNREGNRLIFEETNHDLELMFRYTWSFSERFGIVKRSALINLAQENQEIEILDGIQNILPFGVPSELQMNCSTLVDAYKVNEWDDDKKLAIYSLSSMVVDKAEPAEALMATTVWSTLEDPRRILLSSQQVIDFRKGRELSSETSVKAEKGAFFTLSNHSLSKGEMSTWLTVCEVNQNSSSIADLMHVRNNSGNIYEEIFSDVLKNKNDLRKKVGLADGIQLSKDRLGTGRHFSNVMFNIMRGGTFAEAYQVETKDFLDHVQHMNRPLYRQLSESLRGLPEYMSYHDLRYFIWATKITELKRFYFEYLPLSWSRRHGDPSRPWNFFSIDLKKEDGSPFRNYEGNWRDIFQNWEALAYSYPEYTLGMVSKFVNASTIDGYNPYRITRQGIDWEVVDPSDPWSHIGYWGDHQIIYLSKLLELSMEFHPSRLYDVMTEDLFTYSNVPYRIKGFDAILSDPKHTINYDEILASRIAEKVNQVGSDGKLVYSARGELLEVNLIEKVLVTTLTKLYNFIPEGGIWLNTQRPEWNDANNALVGNGVSMVTLYYLRRFLEVLENALDHLGKIQVGVNKPVVVLLESLHQTFRHYQAILSRDFTPNERFQFITSLGLAGEHYRTSAYDGFTGEKKDLSLDQLKEFVGLAKSFMDHSISRAKRSDGLYHAYNLMEHSGEEMHVRNLYKMLEGQVAALSAGTLEPKEALEVLDALKKSDMFREDQYSYMLYPDRELPTFLQRNNIEKSDVNSSRLLQRLIANGDKSIVEQDRNGGVHFNGHFQNAADLSKALEQLNNVEYGMLLREESSLVHEIFEKVFDHMSFTGRSGSFYGYEGLGSIYWHMVSKLLLAVQENIKNAFKLKADESVLGGLISHYYEIRAGIGINKSPELYGAFPTDAYSHTPKNAGARQPGMTGQVKEDVINRWAELGIEFHNGHLVFNPLFLRESEFIDDDATLTYFGVSGEIQKLDVPAGAMAFTYCQIPVMYSEGEEEQMLVVFNDGTSRKSEKLRLTENESKEVFKRSGKIESIAVTLKGERLLK